MAQYLVAARHGLSEANANLTMTECGLYYSNSGSDPAVPLMPEGIKQGAEMGRRLARLFPRRRRLSRAYHTDFARVMHTLDEIAARLPYEVERICDPRLNKRSYGQFWNLTRKGVEELHPDEWQRYLREGDLLYRPPGGENYFDLFTRVDQFIDQVIMPSSENLLVLTHSVVLLAFQRKLEGMSDEKVLRLYEETALPNAHIIVWCRAAVNAAWERCDDEFIGVHSPGL